MDLSPAELTFGDRMHTANGGAPNVSACKLSTLPFKAEKRQKSSPRPDATTLRPTGNGSAVASERPPFAVTTPPSAQLDTTTTIARHETRANLPTVTWFTVHVRPYRRL